ncbi:MAG: right-handed parallel beta-helix repeat-containing protein [Candidatus Bathyarchaeota archaeon]|nr:right-handed parallel beta-helix repeat-containing protein [Candidatus Bathyarchaeota archaeon]
MRKTSSILLAITILFTLAAFPIASPATAQPITINPDGSINPPSAPLNRNGSLYTLTSDLSSPIDVKSSNIILDGKGYTIIGDGSAVAVELECENVTVQNFRLVDWKCGVLGVYDNNTVENCVIKGCSDYALKIYAQYYIIIGNDIENNAGAILIGPGGLNYIAGNKIVNNQHGLCFYDSGNLVVQNIIENCTKSAVVLIAQAWNQMIYSNNFINNTEELDDGTISNRGRPAQSQILPWDNGVSGNYWSDYTEEKDNLGIGTVPKIIFTNYDVIAPDFSFFDRYPLTSQVNIDKPIPAVPYYMTKQAAVAPNLSSQAKAVSFFNDTIGLDLKTYTPVLSSFYDQTSIAPDKMSTPLAGQSTEYLEYELQSNEQGPVEARVIVVDGNLVYCDLFCYGKILFANSSLSNNSEKAQSILHNYYVWTDDPEVEQMSLNVGSANSSIVISSNLLFVGRNGTWQHFLNSYTRQSFDWYHHVNGADYTGVDLFFEEGRENMHEIFFSDTRSLYQIGDSSISISEEQAIDIAENYVKGYSYKAPLGATESAVVSGLEISNGSTASLATALRDPKTLFPCWVVQVPLDKTYPDYTNAITVRVWADSGRVMDALRQVSTPLYDENYASLWRAFSYFSQLIVIGAVLVLGVVLVIVGLLQKRKKETAQPSKITN